MSKITIISLIVVVSLITGAAPVPIKKESERLKKALASSTVLKQVKEVCSKIQALCIIRQLDLNKEQLEVLRQVSQRAISIRENFEQNLSKIMEEHEVIYEKFLEEDLQNTGFTPEVEHRAAAASHKEKELKKKFCDKINSLEGIIREMLNPAQISVIENSSLNEGLKQLPYMIRNTNKSYRQYIGGDGVGTIQTGILEESEDLSQLSPRERLKEIHAQKNGSIGIIGKMLINEELLPSISSSSSQQTYTIKRSSMDMDDCREKIEGLRADINLLNLINGMNFSQHQLLHLAKLAEEAKNLTQTNLIYEQPDDATLMEIHKNLLAISAYLTSAQEVPESLIYETERLGKKALAKKPKPFEVVSKPIHKEINRLSTEVELILFDNQKETLIDYKPCLIPPKNLKDPVRVGQANDSSRWTKMLAKIRSIPDTRYEENKDHILNEIISRAQNHGGMFTDEEKEAVAKRLETILSEARAMSDVDFEINKDEISSRLTFLDLEETLQQQIKEKTGDTTILTSKIKSNLLNARIIPLLHARYKQLTETKTTRTVDLDRISPAENCRSGSCAIN